MKATLRRLLKTPGSSAVAVLALALGIGLSGTMLSYVDLLMFRGMPVKDAQQIHNINIINSKTGEKNFLFHITDFVDYREQQTAFTDIGAVTTRRINIGGESQAPVDCLASTISVNTHDLLGVQPILGRPFLPEESHPGAEPVCIIGKRIWENVFNADEDILGKFAHINQRKYRIVGVMNPNFGFPMNSDAWFPLTIPNKPDYRSRPWVQVFGRLKTDHSKEQAASEFGVIFDRLKTKRPEDFHELNAASVSLFGQEVMGSGAVKTMWLMVFAAIGVLFIACANVANLLLVRSALRTRELAVRAALGASRRSLIINVLVESFALAALGSLAGAAIAIAGFEAQNYYYHLFGVPYWWMVEPNWRLFALVAGLTCLVAFVAGLYPALRSSRPYVMDTLKDSAGTTTQAHGFLSRGLVVAQLAISCGLVSTAGMLAFNGYELRQPNVPYDPHAIVAAKISPESEHYDGIKGLTQLYTRLLTEVRSHPEVEQAALVSHRGVYDTARGPVMIEGQHHEDDENRPWTRRAGISPGYFKALGVPIIRGRDFRETDEKVAIINAPMAERLWPDENPLGKRFKKPGEWNPWLTVIGIVPDLKMAGRFNDNKGGEEAFRKAAGYYRPHTEDPWETLSLIVKPRGLIANASKSIRESVAAIDPTIPILDVNTLGGSMESALIILNTVNIMFGIFGLSAILLAAIGLYGIISFAVTQRTREIGIRMALGAARRQVFGMVIQQGFLLLLIGLPLGAALGTALNYALTRALPGLTADPTPVWITTLSALTAATLLAILSPAWKAIHVNPMNALRHD